MGVDLNPGITPGLGGVNGAQPVDPTKQVADPSQANPGVDAGASEAVPGVWSQLQQWIATSGLQGTAAVDSPEIAAQQQSAQVDANETTGLQSGLASQSLGNAGRTPAANDEQGTPVEPVRDHNVATRSQVGPVELSLPAAATAAQAGTTGQDAVPQQLLQPNVLSSLVSGQPQPMWPLGDGADEPRLRRRSRRDREQSSDGHDDALFEDDVPEQRVRERDGRDGQAEHNGNEARAGDDWCAALARRLARIRTVQAAHPTHAAHATPGPHDTTGAAAAALSLARDQWSQGRAVLIVCPQRVPMDDNGWACLVWGDTVAADARAAAGATRRAGSRGAVATAPVHAGIDTHAHPQANPTAQPMPRLRGQRFIARLHWKSDALDDDTASTMRWWAVRAAKQHGVALGRQLRTMSEGAGAQAHSQAGDADPAAARARHDGLHTQGMAIQLGPVLLPQARDWSLRVRIDAVQRLWAALEGQWSLLVVGCDEPLLPG